jgi:protein-S-isoprenylcysteine O-methyltransferase Ste14
MATNVFIYACWAAWLAFWVAMALRTKRTLERSSLLGYRLVGLVTLGLCLGALRLAGVQPHAELWREGPGSGVPGDVLVLCGFMFTIWARITLAGNWSAEVTFKEDHELIQSGPYALARHPIYTGLFAMTLGTAVAYGRAIGFALLLAVICGVWWKARQEESVMSSHFPGAYDSYRARVRAVIPFVL